MRRSVSQTSSAGGRPALVTFAAILLIMLGGFELALAITEFFRYAFGALSPLADATYSIFWGVLDALYGPVLLYGGYALLQGQVVGRTVALIVADFAAIRWFFYMWYVPWAAALIIGLCAGHLRHVRTRGLLRQRLSAAVTRSTRYEHGQTPTGSRPSQNTQCDTKIASVVVVCGA
jgi:hypothetical protein